MVPFVIASRSRCGSHMLRTALDRHPAVCCRPELFHPNFFEGRTALEHLKRLFDAKCQSSGFLFLHWTQNQLAIGETHPDFRSHRELLLKQVPDLRVIILHRENLLERYVSLQLTRQHGAFHAFRDPRRSELQPITIDIADLLDSFRLHEDELIDDLTVYADRMTLQVSYEQLTDCWNQVGDAVQEFLGVERHPLLPATFKQSHYTHVRHVIVNYRDVLDAIAQYRLRANDPIADSPRSFAVEAR